MRHFKHLLTMALAIVCAIPQTVSAQTKLALPSSPVGDPSANATQKVTAKSSNVSESDLRAFSGTLIPAADRAAFSNYVSVKGTKPVRTKTVRLNPNAPEDTTLYHYTGYNVAAGQSSDGQSTGGWVNFNVWQDYSNNYNPTGATFSCDTVSSDEGATEYSVRIGDKIYSFKPITTNYTTYPTITKTVYDANTLKVLSRTTCTTSHNGDKAYVPYILAYDDNTTGLVYAISMGNGITDADGFTSEEPYYLNIVDTATCELKRLGKIGSYYTDGREGSITPKGLTCNYGTLYLNYSSNNVFYIGRINTQEFTIEKIGSLNIPSRYGAYGLQPMVYDTRKYKLLLNHYDFENGTQYYLVDTYAPWGSTVDTVGISLVENAPTGFTFFYERPEGENRYTTYTHQFQPVSDFTITVPEGSTTATISFTTPDSVYADGTKMQFEYYNYKTLTAYLSSTNHKDNFYITSPFPRSLQYNTHYEGTVELPEGMNIISLKLSASDYNLYVEPVMLTKSVVVGYDAPSAPDNAKLSIDGTTATVTWDAPTTGKYADFDAPFDATDLTYKVVRSDGYVVDSTLTATTVNDTVPEEIQSWSYDIYAISHGNSSDVAQTNRASGGTYMGLPYEEDFTASDCLDPWTVINANDDGSYNTWQYSTYTGFVSTPWGRDGDDWLITPGFRLKADSLYRLSFQTGGHGNLRVTYGQGNTAEAQSNILAEITSTEEIASNNSYYTSYDTETKDYYFRPAADGTYNIGFYNYNTPEENNHWTIDTVKVECVATIEAPDSVSGLAFVPADKGALSGTLNFTLPSTSINGQALSALTKVSAYDVKGNLVATNTTVSPGNAANLEVSAVHGYNYYYIVAANEKGEGYPQVVKAYVGPDMPQPVSNIRLTWSDENDSTINLDYAAATAIGQHGGYVDPATVKYNIYTYKQNSWPQRSLIATADNNETLEIQIQGLNGTQDQVVLTVTAQNDEGESLYRNAGIVLGETNKLPFVEPFAAQGLKYSPWIVRPGLNSKTWTTDQGNFNANVQPQNNDQLDLIFAPSGSEGGSGYFESPIIDFRNATHPLMTVWVYNGPGVSSDAWFTIDGITNGTDITAVADTIKLTGNNGWQLHVFDLSKLAGKKAQVVMTAYAPTPADRIWADNWNIAEASGKDLAVTGITAARNATVGDKLGIDVTVANLGLSDASDYSVLFNVNDETVAETPAETTLASGKEQVFHFELPVTVKNAKDLMYNATVMMDGDEVEANNTSTDVDVNATQIDLNAPTDLAINGNEATWNAPAEYNGYTVTEGFETTDAFLTDNFDGWNSINGDGHLTTSFVQYYGNYWPYFGAAVSWMTWSTTEAGSGVNSAKSTWGAYNGDKCLIDWGNYGADADGRTNSSEPEDDWLISPEIVGGTDFSFQIKYNDAVTIDILTSSTGREPADFTNTVKTITATATTDWNLQSVTLPADAKYVALHVTQNGFGILVDDITYTKAEAPKLLGYNIYRGNEQVDFVTDTKATLSRIGDYSVSAVYDLGESALTNVATGINEISSANESAATYYDVNGRLLPSKPAQRGVYIIKQAGKTRKVVVK